MKRKIGANAPCPCGSGQTYESCCRGTKKVGGGSVRSGPMQMDMFPDVSKAVELQKERFRKHFGREPDSGENLYFDARSQEDADWRLIRDMLTVGLITSAFVFTYRQTGMMIFDSCRDRFPPEDLYLWDMSNWEYRSRLAAGEPDDMAPRKYTRGLSPACFAKDDDEVDGMPSPDALNAEAMEFMMSRRMKEAATRPELVYAFEKTGRIVTEANRQYLSDEDLEEWNAAIGEYFVRKEAGELDDEITPEDFEPESPRG